MIVVDSSVWIGHLRNEDTASVRKFRAIEDTGSILVADMVVLEVLQGARDDLHGRQIQSALLLFQQANLLSTELAIRAASNYRFLRSRGITIRKTADLIIGTYCIEFNHLLLHDDRDFDPMVTHLGLKVF